MVKPASKQKTTAKPSKVKTIDLTDAKMASFNQTFNS